FSSQIEPVSGRGITALPCQLDLQAAVHIAFTPHALHSVCAGQDSDLVAAPLKRMHHVAAAQLVPADVVWWIQVRDDQDAHGQDVWGGRASAARPIYTGCCSSCCATTRF